MIGTMSRDRSRACSVREREPRPARIADPCSALRMALRAVLRRFPHGLPVLCLETSPERLSAPVSASRYTHRGSTVFLRRQGAVQRLSGRVSGERCATVAASERVRVWSGHELRTVNSVHAPPASRIGAPTPAQVSRNRPSPKPHLNTHLLGLPRTHREHGIDRSPRPHRDRGLHSLEGMLFARQRTTG